MKSTTRVTRASAGALPPPVAGPTGTTPTPSPMLRHSPSVGSPPASPPPTRVLVQDDRRRLSSWSGWMPGSGMTMFTAGEDPWGMQPPPIWRMDGDERMPRPLEQEGPPQSPPTPDQQPKKRGHEEEEEEEEEDSRRGGSKANASFNAWFPIVLGMYPGAEDAATRSRAEWKGADERGVAAVANSVNHGKSGVASSHAIIYSGEPPTRRKASHDVNRPADYTA